MDETPAYLIVGRGRWASLIEKVLIAERRHASLLQEARIASGESETAYQRRLETAMRAKGADIAWLCVPFGSWTSTIVAAAMHAGLDVIAECPWLCPPTITESLQVLEQTQQRFVSLHYEYCMLDELQSWQGRFAGGAACTFHGVFSISRPGRYGSVAALQLGSHLLAMRRFAVPDATIGRLDCRYESADRRSVSLEKEGVELASIDFTLNQQPLIQRYIHAFELARTQRLSLFGLDFAARIAAEVRGLL